MVSQIWTLGLRSLELRTIRKGQIKIINPDERIALITIDGKGAKQRSLFIVDELYDRVLEYIIEDNFTKLVAKANIKSRFSITCHTLRHSCATELNEKKVDMLTIQNILGHSSPKTTMTYYIHATEEMKRTALEKLPLVQYRYRLSPHQ